MPDDSVRSSMLAGGDAEVLTWIGRAPLSQYIAVLALLAAGLAVVAWHCHWYAVVGYATAVYATLTVLLALAARRVRREAPWGDDPSVFHPDCTCTRIQRTMFAWKPIALLTFGAVMVVKLYLRHG